MVSKPDIITNVYCEKSIVSDPLAIEDEVKLTCQRSKFVLDSSSNEYSKFLNGCQSGSACP